MEKKDLELIIYEGAMCCSTGLCGPSPDETLIEFSETVKKLQKEYATLEIKRASITYNLGMFLENEEIFKLVKEKGQNVLPITTLNGKVIATQRYMKYDELKKILSGEKYD
jgi:hypothetical protein